MQQSPLLVVEGLCLAGPLHGWPTNPTASLINNENGVCTWEYPTNGFCTIASGTNDLCSVVTNGKHKRWYTSVNGSGSCGDFNENNATPSQTAGYINWAVKIN
jgi:hypothetical protein